MAIFYQMIFFGLILFGYLVGNDLESLLAFNLAETISRERTALSMRALYHVVNIDLPAPFYLDGERGFHKSLVGCTKILEDERHDIIVVVCMIRHECDRLCN